jgi:transcriptional regulator with XRE-family HTH domain
VYRIITFWGISKRYKKNSGVKMLEEITFGEWLSRRRKSMGLTQKQLADLINCATITLRKIEAEQRRPSALLAERLGIYLNIPAGEQNSFIHYARGESLYAPSAAVEIFPWQMPDASSHSRYFIPVTQLVGREK